MKNYRPVASKSKVSFLHPAKGPRSKKIKTYVMGRQRDALGTPASLRSDVLKHARFLSILSAPEYKKCTYSIYQHLIKRSDRSIDIMFNLLNEEKNEKISRLLSSLLDELIKEHEMIHDLRHLVYKKFFVR